MLDTLWMAGNAWQESGLLQGLTYLCVGVLIFIFLVRFEVSRQQFQKTKRDLQDQLHHVTTKKTDKTYQLSPLKNSWGQRQKLVAQIPAFLQALSHSLQAGYTVPMALEFIADEIEMPLQQEIKIINQKLRLQVSLSEALTGFAKKTKSPEVDFFVESTLIQIKTGGNLVKLFDKIAALIEEKLKLKRDIKSFTSQGKLSGILIAALWPISVIAFSWLSPAHSEVLFHTPAGQAMLATSLIFEMAGFFFIWKIISIKI